MTTTDPTPDLDELERQAKADRLYLCGFSPVDQDDQDKLAEVTERYVEQFNPDVVLWLIARAREAESKDAHLANAAWLLRERKARRHSAADMKALENSWHEADAKRRTT